ncbi:MAG: ribosome maturation factor RimP [Sphingomonadales bacterium]|jgi:ribosome maturation factor RimP|nr:ribosome maturation factor RimP [Sphingomonadales bacterium]
MADIAELTRLIEPEAEAEGLALVRVKMTGGTSDPTLQVMAERPDTRQLTLEDCARLSRRLSDKLDALEAEGRDPIEESYRLEVSSPGIDRPLTRLSDYDDWKGHEARIHPHLPYNGRKQLSGDLIGVDGDTVRIDVKGLGETAIPFASIRNAKLLMTDRLIKATAPLSADGADIVEEETGPRPSPGNEEGQD